MNSIDIIRHFSSNLLTFLLICLVCTSGIAQKNNKMEQTKNNPLLCDTAGVCETPAAKTTGSFQAGVQGQKPVKVIYFTDPICSACWAIEPQLRRLKLEYGDAVDIEYRMGGLLPDWSYSGGGISKPADVAHHWEEMAAHYQMPIDGGVWLDDPLDSSYPPSIAFKAAQIQDEAKAVSFLRTMREMVFVRKKNIAKEAVILEAAALANLDVEKMKKDIAGPAKIAFENDLRLAAQMGVRGFPTLFFMNQAQQHELIYGSKPYAQFEHAVKKLAPEVQKQEYARDWKELFNTYQVLATREYAELAEPVSYTHLTLPTKRIV